ncbi:MAG: hypothetical protein AVDCRST_MAG73-2074 [uncultured Thermomicrobiales bacterium]|uniref:Roadblock/LAMTOR2 domain-containing protein n=1 Tax=uncultured Thermomicrobiales bacterium TaxID=1645740 RepID=A0A6J4U6T9_9BACT|nr:MAG: hypothetical protein AVDCRST_MAG73-2074 [uncultured Thermomicrobiales bacterium]
MTPSPTVAPPGCPAGHAAAFDPNLSQMVIDEAISDAITGVLHSLIRDSHASSGMVLDRAGQIIVWDGDVYRDEMMMLGAPIAGTHASTREMARIPKEDNVRMLLQEGAQEMIFTEAVGNHCPISVIFDRHTPLFAILARALESNRERPRTLDAGLARVTKDTSDLFFRDDQA